MDDATAIEEWKLAALRLGEYRCPPPPVYHGAWSEADWVKWIDLAGTWNRELYRCDPPPSS